jgi:hypothetical protein
MHKRNLKSQTLNFECFVETETTPMDWSGLWLKLVNFDVDIQKDKQKVKTKA